MSLVVGQLLQTRYHPSLPAVHDFFAEVGNEYLVMEYIEGEDLQTVLDRHMQSQGGPLPEKPVLLWIDQVLDGVIDWELFFFVPRGRAREYSLSAQVYRLEK